MSYAEQGKNPLRNVIGIGAVGLLHLVLIYALVNGLGKSIVDRIRQPVETRIIQEAPPPPPPEAPPPPPPQFAAPPPPFVPPPEIQVEQAPAQHAITSVTHDAPPPGAPLVTRPSAPTPAPAAPVIPDHAFSARAISGGSPTYPEQYADSPRPGNVTVSCTIETDGRPVGCKVLSSQGGSAFATETLRWLSSSSVRYSPAVRNGQPVSEEHVWTVKYQVE